MTPASTDPNRAAASICLGLKSGCGNASPVGAGSRASTLAAGGAYGLTAGSSATTSAYHARMHGPAGPSWLDGCGADQGGDDAHQQHVQAHDPDDEHVRHAWAARGEVVVNGGSLDRVAEPIELQARYELDECRRDPRRHEQEERDPDRRHRESEGECAARQRRLAH